MVMSAGRVIRDHRKLETGLSVRNLDAGKTAGIDLRDSEADSHNGRAGRVISAPHNTNGKLD